LTAHHRPRLSYAEGVGVVLPCYRIYAAAGKQLHDRGSLDPRYQRWIARLIRSKPLRHEIAVTRHAMI
jgi:thiaminase